VKAITAVCQLCASRSVDSRATCRVLDILVAEDLDHALLAGRHAPAAEAGAVRLVDDDAVGGRGAEEREAVGDECSGGVPRELCHREGVVQGCDQERQVSVGRQTPPLPNIGGKRLTRRTRRTTESVRGS